MRAKTNTTAVKLNEVRAAWGDRGDQQREWSALELQTDVLNRDISRWMACVEAHPRFHTEFVSHQAYASRLASEAALKSADEAKSAAQSAQLNSALGLCCRR